MVIGGQIAKQRVADITAKIAGDKASIEIKSDIEAAMAIKTGAADLYLGACNTGGGGALAMAIALLGMGQCATVSMPGNIKSEAEIKAEVEAGKKAYGFTAQHAEEVIPVILKYLL
ncbi:DUF2620 family protein [Clostridium perfringens]|uniref:DUF2620 family protein n=1 Tax=Clostridium perfringens TaxID=1502 RepID=A0AAW9KI43_CLOPF|nr:DUF2620 family protein [Clostridium perfringens]